LAQAIRTDQAAVGLIETQRANPTLRNDRKHRAGSSDDRSRTPQQVRATSNRRRLTKATAHRRRAYALSLPTKEAFACAGGTLSRHDDVFIRLHQEAGLQRGFDIETSAPRS
jgi:hypothetical protein